MQGTHRGEDVLAVDTEPASLRSALGHFQASGGDPEPEMGTRDYARRWYWRRWGDDFHLRMVSLGRKLFEPIGQDGRVCQYLAVASELQSEHS